MNNKLSQFLAISASAFANSKDNSDVIQAAQKPTTGNRPTKPTFFKNKQRAKVRAARKANRMMRKRRTQ